MEDHLKSGSLETTSSASVGASTGMAALAVNQRRKTMKIQYQVTINTNASQSVTISVADAGGGNSVDLITSKSYAKKEHPLETSSVDTTGRKRYEVTVGDRNCPAMPADLSNDIVRINVLFTAAGNLEVSVRPAGSCTDP